MKLVPAFIDRTIAGHESPYLLSPFLDALGRYLPIFESLVSPKYGVISCEMNNTFLLSIYLPGFHFVISCKDSKKL